MKGIVIFQITLIVILYNSFTDFDYMNVYYIFWLNFTNVLGFKMWNEWLRQKICFTATDGVYGTPESATKYISNSNPLIFNFSTALNDAAKNSQHRLIAGVPQTPPRMMFGKYIFSKIKNGNHFLTLNENGHISILTEVISTFYWKICHFLYQ